MFRVERPLTPLDEPPLPTVVPVEPISEGSWVTVVKTLVLACFTRSAALITVVGVGASKPEFIIRDEDTITDSGGFRGPCAKAGRGDQHGQNGGAAGKRQAALRAARIGIKEHDIFP